MSLEFQGVGHRYGRDEVLKGVTLTAKQGEITCLLGASGSGKSTLLRLAAGLERIQAGEIRLDGGVLSKPGIDPPPERRPVGLVFQDQVLFPHKTALDNVAFGLRELDPRQRRIVAQANLDAVGLGGFSKRYPDTLSGGQQQRVALARALAPAPRVMLLDEPFANVDATLRRSLREDARRALRKSGSIAVIVTHDPDEALELADRIAVMDSGRIVQIDTPDAIWRQPKGRAVAGLFGEAQHLARQGCSGRCGDGLRAAATDVCRNRNWATTWTFWCDRTQSRWNGLPSNRTPWLGSKTYAFSGTAIWFWSSRRVKRCAPALRILAGIRVGRLL